MKPGRMKWEAVEALAEKGGSVTPLPLNKESLNKESLNKKSLNKESINKKPVSEKLTDKGAVTDAVTETVTKESVGKEPTGEALAKKIFAKKAPTTVPTKNEPAKKEPAREGSVEPASGRKDKDHFVTELARDHGPALERYLARKMDNPADAAEIAQEALLRLHRLERPETLDNPRAFLFQVASNLAVDQLRRRRLHFRFLKIASPQAAPEDLPGVEGGAPSPEQILAGQQKLARIYQAVERLPEKCRQAFLLHRTRGMSYGDIARELGVSVSSVEKYILEALKQCRAELAAYYREGGEDGGE